MVSLMQNELFIGLMIGPQGTYHMRVFLYLMFVYSIFSAFVHFLAMPA